VIKLKALTLLSNEEILNRVKNLKNWDVVDLYYIKGIFNFKDFVDALDFVIKVGSFAEPCNIIQR
jgi:pterin-4a-carbinolamine dehydratase